MRDIAFTININLSARSACTSRRAGLASSVATQQLGFYGNGEGLVFLHTLGRLRMKHDAVIEACPLGSSFHRFAHKAILQAQLIAGIGFIGKKVTEAVVELIAIGIITHFQQTIFHTEGVAEVLTYGIAANLDRPAFQVFSIEKRNPFSLLLTLRRRAGRQA